MRYFWMISLCFFLAGCNRTYVGVPLVQTDPETEGFSAEYPPVSPGTEIRLTLRDGRIVKARLDGFEDEFILFSEARLEGGTKDSFNEIQSSENEVTSKQYRIKLADLALLEKTESNSSGEVIGSVLVVGTLVGVGLLVANSDEWMEWDN